MGPGARRAPQRGQGATAAAAYAVAALVGFGSLGLGQAYEITSEMKLEYGALAASGETRPPPPPARPMSPPPLWSRSWISLLTSVTPPRPKLCPYPTSRDPTSRHPDRRG